MARLPLLQLKNVTLGFGGAPLLADLDLTLNGGVRLALVGRNGCGKSTLLKLMAGLIAPDKGERTAAPGAKIGYLPQEPDFTGFATLGDYAAQDLAEGEAYLAEKMAEGLKFRPALSVAAASGGERRRAALARLLAAGPDLMLLDEPTNHLDLEAILWLEALLAGARTGFVMISHDRAFLSALSQGTLWLDRGVLRRRDGAFDGFETWREATWAEEDSAAHKLARKIKAEARWAVEGISARRKRNQGRLRALAVLRAERAAALRRPGQAALALDATSVSGARVIEAEGLTLGFEGRVLVKDLSLKLARGDRLAIIGPNGAGKTTLLNALTGKAAPLAGRVRRGEGVQLAEIDQRRAALDGQASLWESLTLDPGLQVSGASDQVMVRGSPRHVVGYLKDFLFEEAQARMPVSALSGGERARLLMARLMAAPANLLVLDEPTNDLDVETLDLLQEQLADYPGTVLFVSHDRDFIDRVASLTLVLDGQGGATLYAGGYSDAKAQGAFAAAPAPVVAAAPPKPVAEAAPKAPRPGKLTFTEKNKLATLPGEMEKLGAEIAKLTELLADATLYARDPVKFAKASEMMTERQSRLQAAEEEWLALAEKEERGA